jgi:hypothetical protein
MKWKSATLCAVAMFGLATGYSQAAERLPVQQQTLSSRRTVSDAQPQRSIFSQISWWARFGQPVEPPPGAEPAVAGEPPVVHDHGYGFGYVYGPGACDCRPPCTDQLWAGYQQMPWRCSHPQYKERYRGFCGSGCGSGCGACGQAIGCTVAAPSCTDSCADACASPVCCKPKCKKQWFAHWHWGKKGCDSCDSCSAPIGCGCAVPVNGAVPAADAPPAVGPPVPAADEASVLKKPFLQRVSSQRINVR